MKKQVFHVNDRVKIINPLFFQRVGYPLNKAAGRELITEEEKQRVSELLDAPCCLENGRIRRLDNGMSDKIYGEILDRLAYWKIAQRGFGGKERKIFTERHSEFLNKIGRVSSKKVVQTGNYEYGQCYETEYNPPYLGDVKSHVILELEMDDWETIDGNLPRIEEIHVEKITDDLQSVKGGWLEKVLADAKIAK